MSRVSVLFDLQQTDSKIDAANTSISNIDQSLADDENLVAARGATAAAETALITARSTLKDLEAAAAKQEQHANDLEAKLYGGQIKGQKEMASAQQEVATFRQRKKETDDQSVEAMIGLETAESDFKAAKARQAAAEAEREKATATLKEERARLETALVGYQIERGSRARSLMSGDLPMYEKLRQQKGGVAVSEVIQGKLCSKCRVELPMAKQREVKGGLTIVNCPSCGRILYHKF